MNAPLLCLVGDSRERADAYSLEAQQHIGDAHELRIEPRHTLSRTAQLGPNHHNYGENWMCPIEMSREFCDAVVTRL
jgi:hypothetical protein